MSDGSPPTTPAVLKDLARRAAIASRLRSQSEERLLQAILDTAVLMFRAEAASLALMNRTGDGLEFAVASGRKREGIIGRTIAVGEGIAGYVLQTGQPIAIASPDEDPRFGRTIAEQTGYVPQSLMAVPLLTSERIVGVIEILDCRDGSFTATDLEIAASFARQAAIAVDAFRVEREFPILVAKSLESYGLVVDQELGDALDSLRDDSPDDFWSLVDAVAAMAAVSPAMRTFIREVLPIAARVLKEQKGPRFG
jgi:GAF domain-containing protein